MMARVHRRVDRQGNVRHVTALCDEHVLGKVLKEGGVTLDLRKHRLFFEGRRVNEAEAVALLKGSRNVNAVGPQAVECAKKALAIDARHVRRVAGVPHIQVYFV